MERSLSFLGQYKFALAFLFLLPFIFLVFFGEILASEKTEKSEGVKEADVFTYTELAADLNHSRPATVDIKKAEIELQRLKQNENKAKKASEFAHLSALAEEHLFQQASGMDAELLQAMLGEDNLAFALNDKAALEDYILRRLQASSDHDKYHWLLLLNSIGLTSSAAQQMLLKEIEVMEHAELLSEALALLTPLSGEHAEKMMNFLSLYVAHPHTEVSAVAVTMLDQWSAVRAMDHL